jgi:hypothetical protein
LARGEIDLNWQHLSTVVWLRWRVAVNQLKRGGLANIVILSVLAILGVALAIALCIAGFLVGRYGLGDTSPLKLLLTWDGVVIGFLFFWLVGLIAELQRSEVFSLSKFLHLPVTLTGVFLINYLSSLVRLSLIVFVPAMLGLSIGLILSRGLAMVWLLPLLFAFFLMVTGLTYQFQGWLASLMANPRRRRTVIVLATLIFVLLAQVPNLLNILPRDRRAQDSADFAAQTELAAKLAAKAIPPEEYQRRSEEIARKRADKEREKWEGRGAWAHLISAVLPPGWLPLGASAAAEGRFLIPLMAVLGMTVIGSAALWRAYRTTLRLYTGQFTATPAKPSTTVSADRSELRWPTLLEKRPPYLSEHAAAIALAGFRSLLRAPEAKMLLLTPIIMVVIFGSMLLTRGGGMSTFNRALLPSGALAMALISFVQLVGNQFGFDRGGFRVFVLTPASRRDILLGKNLAIAPLAVGIGWLMVLLIQVIAPLRFDHLLAVIPQSISMFLIFCMMANFLSIVAPMPIAAGTMRVVKPGFVTILLQLAFMLAFPIAMSPTILPLAIEALVPSIPLTLILSVIFCVIVIVIYRIVLTSQGHLLQSRELKILEAVTRTNQ